MAANQTEKARQFQALHAAAGCVCDRQCMGCGIGADSGRRWLSGVGDLERGGGGVLGRRDGRSPAMSRWRMRARWWKRRICRCRPTWRRASVIRRRMQRSLSVGWRYRSCRRFDRGCDGRSEHSRCSMPGWRANALSRRSRRRGRWLPFHADGPGRGVLRGKPDLDDVIRRLQAFEAAGADVLMAPGLPDLDAVRDRLCGVVEAVQLHGGDQGEVLLGAGTGRGGREADQPCHIALSCSDERTGPCSPRGEGTRDPRLCRFFDSDAGLECFHARLSKTDQPVAGGIAAWHGHLCALSFQ